MNTCIIVNVCVKYTTETLFQDEKVRCPMSGKVLKLKDLIDVHFTPINDRDSKKALIVKDVS